jgi:TolA-binding protein
MRKYPLLFVTLSLAGMTVRAAADDTPEEQLAAASALFEARRYDVAAQKLDAFLAANPKHPKTGVAALALGRARAELKQYDKAVPAYEKVIATKDPALVATAQLGLGEAAINTRQFEKAATALEAVIKTTLKPEQSTLALLWLGQADYELKRYGPSMDAYDRLTRDFPNSEYADSAWYASGLAALRLGKTDEARQRLRTVVDRYRRSEDRPQALLVLAQMDLQAKRYPQARSGFESLANGGVQGESDEVKKEAEDGLIQTLLAQGDNAAVVPRLESAISRLPANDPQRFRAQLSLGHARYRQKQYDPALAAYQEAAKSSEEAVAGEGLYWAANADLGLNRPADAGKLFASIPTKYPRHDLAAKAQLKAASAFQSAGQTEAAAAAYRAVIAKYPGSPQAAEAKTAMSQVVEGISDSGQLATALKDLPIAERGQGTLRLARLYINEKKYTEAGSILSDLSKAHPADDMGAEAQYLMGVTVDAQQKSQAAVGYLSNAVRLRPDAMWSGDAQSRLAWLYLELKQPANAEKAATAALSTKLEPQAEQQARLALVQADLDQQKWDAALEGSKTLMSGNPPEEVVATVLFTQAWVSEKRGKPDEAQPLWEKLASEHPKSPYTPEALLRLGDAQLKAEKYDDARSRYSTLVTNFPKSSLAVEARFKMGSALYNSGKAEDAAREFDTVAEDKAAGAYQAEGLYWAGVALDKAGKKTDAIQRLTKLVAQYPTNSHVANAKVRLAALKAVAGE